jgi:hypothetical protein
MEVGHEQVKLMLLMKLQRFCTTQRAKELEVFPREQIPVSGKE